MRYLLVDPQSRLNWSFDWSRWLAEGDEVTSYSWSITPAGPELSGDSADVVTVLGPLALGHIYTLTCRVTTSSGVQEEQSIVLRVDET
jgi:hypothetical protein